MATIHHHHFLCRLFPSFPHLPATMSILQSVIFSLLLTSGLSFSTLASAPRVPTTQLASSSGEPELAPLNPRETAVLLTKYQNDFAAPGGKIYETVKEVMDATNMLENSRVFMDFARKVGCTIVHCPLSTEKGVMPLTAMPYGVVERVQSADAIAHGEWGEEICEMMTPAPEDLVVPKYGMCAFSSTDLDNLLRERGIKNVIVIGFLTNGSVESTIRTAYEKCYRVYVLPECCAACSMPEHVFSVEQNLGMFAELATGVAMMNSLMSN